ncbi:hypothetical protein H112_04294 [Trichophyton rubrum D6]|uniref:Helicase ATP-binding domain-containing protein n=2 Tax=Trichophyton rubrum TaxID=5551 RepID=F2SPS2_TRIRC|nr:uncharacterized protein TERG_04071 [Trichophyton rubrum CBS 118892]EZF22789.1 hypothetical protein H100_04301 [Trichophyton rubrum MR850]EZF42041.1 hypothetical protein H102_04286 [Trichophyton rubrum CBS 100081]EZF52651.1 hypothetical protein H103_04294 [Trichophyton rubrum CBS 288.86]EZF63247.1 hypothetical protein H104_04284 [Trichophyton rubrum CBS 289.86]EZF84582.1 hypothetical protein H110_04289 [Trichophyton rubrum MR1448]EZF95265.1 hypothetical protein H113_04329 [Trichophyton rubr
MEKMQRDRLPTTVVKAAIRKQKQDLAKKAKEDAAKMRANARALAQQKKGNPMFANLSQGTEPTQQTESLDELLSQSIAFNPRETEKIVEKFGMDETELSQMPMSECPPQLSTELLPYQRQGLAWMLDRESPSLPKEGSDDIVQLWKRVGKRYMNIATNYSSSTAPPLASGGILADDMGLGKTLQVISLILANSTPKTSKSSKATLIISPLGVMSNWRDQIAAHIHKEYALRVLTYHGSGKKEAANLSQYDVVITTYGALASEYGQLLSATGKLAKTKRGLFAIRWRRVVLDEGHTIRTPKTKAACAACMLEADSRWSLTGTPIVNNLKDLYSQGKFIRLSGGLEDLPVFHSALIRPLNAGDENASLLLQALMATICLRRRKDMSFVNLRLPPMESHILHVKFLPHEKEKYEMFEYVITHPILNLIKQVNNTNTLGPRLRVSSWTSSQTKARKQHIPMSLRFFYDFVKYAIIGNFVTTVSKDLWNYWRRIRWLSSLRRTSRHFKPYCN